jgi:hypothetical protein
MIAIARLLQAGYSESVTCARIVSSDTLRIAKPRRWALITYNLMGMKYRYDK